MFWGDLINVLVGDCSSVVHFFAGFKYPFARSHSIRIRSIIDEMERRSSAAAFSRAAFVSGSSRTPIGFNFAITR